jgi:biopolymer transport protein ExbB
MSLATIAAAQDDGLRSLFEMVVGGGPLMVPLALCSVVALAFAVERWVRLRSSLLGSPRHVDEVVRVLREDGAAKASEVCGDGTPLARILRAALSYADAPLLEREKVVEDVGGREVKNLTANLLPLMAVAMIAPLLGLLGTVWGMIEAFSSIALDQGLGNPEILASGISQALITTAAGLAIAIPTQALYYFYKSRIERFARRAEDAYSHVSSALGGAA